MFRLFANATLKRPIPLLKSFYRPFTGLAGVSMVQPGLEDQLQSRTVHTIISKHSCEIFSTSTRERRHVTLRSSLTSITGKQLW